MTDSGALQFAVVLDGKGGGQMITQSQINPSLAAKQIVWLHVDIDGDDAHALLESVGVPSDGINSLLVQETRPSLFTLDHALFVSLRGVNMNPQQDPEDMVSIRVYLSQFLIVTTRRRYIFSADHLRDAILIHKGPKTSGEFLVMLITELTQRMTSVITDLSDTVDGLEESMLIEQTYVLRNKISEVRRDVISIKRHLQPQKEVLAELIEEDTTLFNKTIRIRLHEAANHLIRYLEELDAARDRAAVMHEELNGRLSERVENRMYVLSVVASIFLPLTFLTGLLGINVGGIPGSDNHLAFAIVCFIAACAVAVEIYIFRKLKWF